MKFVIYPDAKGEWRWRLKASNGLIVADGAESYASKGNCRRAVNRLIRLFEVHDGAVEVWVGVA